MRRCFFLLALFLPGWGQTPRATPTFAVSSLDNGQVAVVVSNPSELSLKFSLPAHAVLTHPQLQDQLLLQPARALALPPKGQSQFRCSALCVGERAEEAEGNGFVLSQQPHPQAEQLQNLFDTCRRLQAEGDLPPLPMLPGNQHQVVTQWAYWSERGQATKEDLAQVIRTQLKPKPQDEPEVQKAIDNTWEAVDLTRKEAQKK